MHHYPPLPVSIRDTANFQRDAVSVVGLMLRTAMASLNAADDHCQFGINLMLACLNFFSVDAFLLVPKRED